MRQLYYACDEQRTRIFDQGMSGFVLGTNDPAEGYISIVLLPAQDALALERAALDESQAVQLLGATYSANAYAFGQRYQNCNQWLQTEGYAPSVFELGWRPLVWLAGLLPWLHTDDHPPDDLAHAQFRVSMPQSIETFVRHRVPEATHIELCYTAQHVVVHHGWEPIAAGCVPAEGDTVLALQKP